MAELFSNFEVNRQPHWPILSRLLGGSLALHLALAASVVYVPTLRDAVSLAFLAGTAEYVDKPYSKTVFGENVQIVRLEPKFQYPPGYFATGLPEATPIPTPTPVVPRILAMATPPKALVMPSPSPSPSALASPSPLIAQSQGSPTGQSGQSGQSADSGASAGENPKTEEDKKKEEAQKQLEQTAAANDVELPKENEINKQPLKDLVSHASDLKNRNELDLNKPFEVKIEAELDSTGRLQNPTVTQKSGEGSMAQLATGAIGAINDSGLLVYLKRLNDGKPTKVTFFVSQDQNAVVASLESEVNSEESARQQAGVFNLMLALGQKARKGKDEEILMKNTIVSSDGKKIVFKFSMPTQAVGDIIKKQIASSTTTKQG